MTEFQIQAEYPRNIGHGFNHDADIREVIKRFGSRRVESAHVVGTHTFEIIGRAGHNGTWVYREEDDIHQWYLTHTLDIFRPLFSKVKP